ncbi:hypothetical protein DPEC_G00062210 [Dallia pectoralis]|uniref:Uncharacterized protein n=1 Tax=Dallia pectoralis TaxID=75939 RepID=A0ACC2H753_DALPE|nr:hypothetical protein DPEC_G00062210 [Dallia pectoralis]
MISTIIPFTLFLYFKVDKVCGPSARESATGIRLDPTPEVTATPGVLLSPSVPSSIRTPEQLTEQFAHLRSSFPLKPSKNDKPRSLKKISREFLSYIQRYKSFFALLPEMLCEGEMVVEDFTCWSGDDVVESYKARVVGNGLHAQKQNPEVKVRGSNPVLAEVKKRLERFNQEILDMLPGLSQKDSWGERGSGKPEDGSGDCDDEDGCQGSGTEPTGTSTDGQPNAAGADGNGYPRGRSPSLEKEKAAGCCPTCLSLPAALTLILATLALQWNLL